VQSDSEALNLGQALGVLRRRVPLIVLCALVVAGAAYGFSKRETKKYTTTASLAFSVNPLSQQIAGLPPSSSGNLLAQQASNLELVKLGDMAAKTASILGHGLTAQSVAESLHISGEGESSVVGVSATATSPALAAEIANTYTLQFVKEQQAANRQYFTSALALVHKQLAALSPQQRGSPVGVQLQDRAQTLDLLTELQYGNVKVAQEAALPTSQSSPKTPKNTLVGGILGLLVGLGLAFVLERLDRDRRIREPEDLEAIYHVPVLGVIAQSPALARPTPHDRHPTPHDGRSTPHDWHPLPAADAEAFQLIRARLRFFNASRSLRTVLITSAAPGDGTSTIARHLAEAAAHVGSRVLLLEADLRDPTLAHDLALKPGPRLQDILAGTASLDEATHPITQHTPPGTQATEHTLDVLPSAPAANPSELLESHAMTALLEQAKSIYDLVLIDTPPLTTTADAFPLLHAIDGVLIVSRLRHSRRDAAQLLHHTLTTSHTPQLGVIANSPTTNPHPHHPTHTNTPSHPTPTPNGTTPTNTDTDKLLPTIEA
jgi:capsular exopolysaccharide synthesis family protein